MGYRGGTSQPLFGGRGRRVTPGGTGRRGHYLKAGRRVHHMHAVARGTLDVEFVERAAKVHSQTSGPGVSSMTCANAAALAVSGLAPVSRSWGSSGANAAVAAVAAGSYRVSTAVLWRGTSRYWA